MMGFLQAAFVIGRRDFVATVYSRSFLFFLVGPLIIIAFSALFGSVTQNAAREDIRTTIGVIADAQEYGAMDAARERLSPAFAQRPLPDLRRFDPGPDEDVQVKDLLNSADKRIVAVLTGGLAEPKLTGSLDENGWMRQQIALIVGDARQQRALAEEGRPFVPTEVEVVTVRQSAGAVATARALTARAGQFIQFMLTVVLAGMLLSNLLEEKSNKVIEVLAAAVPVNAIFVGKIVSMLAISLVGIAVWTTGGALVTMVWSSGGVALPEPAVGWPLFVLLLLIYYAANYLLLGALFLGIGSQASSVREVQTLSMPVTVGQMLIFLLASFAVGPFNSSVGIGAAIFPFSSPLTMVARAAQTPELWPHFVAIVWQALWVWLIVMLGAAMFRRNVLKSGSGSKTARKV